jgi:UTP-glucose-1-phosphate uridylyltransferase
MKGPILVVLAAGMGSRYGGLKQMDKIGKNGEVLLDFSVYDAVKSGFEKVVFIIRHDIEKDFRELVLARMGSKVKWELAFQDPDSLIPPDIFEAAQKAGRTKPWGTGHALLCAAEKIDAPFTVLNADDFYGREAFAVMCKHLSGPDAAVSAIVPYRLDKTLSPQGTVTRGVCEVKDGYLTCVDELTAIEKAPSIEGKDGRIFNTAPDGSIRELAPETPVSMNFWGF